MSRKNKHQKNQKGKGTTLANQADRYVLYEKAVQCVEAEIDMVDETFQSLRSRTARILREDFAVQPTPAASGCSAVTTIRLTLWTWTKR
mgnify:CR=1 FL=1